MTLHPDCLTRTYSTSKGQWKSKDKVRKERYAHLTSIEMSDKDSLINRTKLRVV